MDIHIVKLLIYVFASMTCIESYAQWDRERTRNWLLLGSAFLIYSFNTILTYNISPARWNHLANVIFTAILCYVLIREISLSQFIAFLLRYILIITAAVLFLFILLVVLFPGQFDIEINRYWRILFPLWIWSMYGILTINLLRQESVEHGYQLFLLSIAFASSFLFAHFSHPTLSEVCGLIACLAAYSFIHHSIQKYWEGIANQNVELNKELNIMMRINERIGRAARTSLDLHSVLEMIADSALWATSASAGIIFLLQQDGTLRAECINGMFPPLEPVTEEVARNPKLLREKLISREYLFGEGIIGEAAQCSRPILVENASADQRIVQALRDTAPIQTLIAAPMRVAGELFGVIAVINKDKRTRMFTRNDQNLIHSIASQAAVAIKTARTHSDIIAERIMEMELKQARQIQVNILPSKCPTVKNLEIAAKSSAARTMSGDYYNFFEYSDNKLGIAIGDVSGKGLPAALVTMTLHTILSQQAIDGKSPQDVISYLNNAMLTILHSNEMFVTMIYGVWDGNTRTFTFSNAGHPHPYIIYANSETCEIIEDSDIALGFLPDSPTTQKSIKLQPNDLMLFFTDGIEDAINTKHEIFGIERIEQFICKNAQLSAHELIETLLQTLEQFMNGAAVHDDYTLIVLKAH